MFLQTLRARMNARLSGDGESGFTLIELLVVMLILGILAAIAIPSFFNQRDKATDAQAKAGARTAQTAIETWATDHGGEYVDGEPPTAGELQEIEPTLNDVELQAPEATADTYTVTVKSGTENEFSISREGEGAEETAGATSQTCTEAGNAGCPSDGNWGD